MSSTQAHFQFDNNNTLPPLNKDKKTLFQEKINYPTLRLNPKNTSSKLEPLPAKEMSQPKIIIGEEKQNVSPWKQEQKETKEVKQSKDRLSLRQSR